MYILEWRNSYGDTQASRLNFAAMTDHQWRHMFDTLNQPHAQIRRIEK